MAVAVWGPFKRGKIWYVRYTVDGAPERWKSLKTSDKGEARRKLLALEKVLANKAAIEERGVSVLRPAAAWALYRQQQEGVRGEYTIADYDLAWRRFWDWINSGGAGSKVQFLHEISPSTGAAWRDWLVRPVSEGGEGCSRTTANDYMRRVGTVWNKLILTEEYRGSNPWAKVERFKGVERERPPEWLDAGEISRVLAAARDIDRDIYLHMALGIFAGMRLEEISLARWPWFAFAAQGEVGVIRIPVRDEVSGFTVKDREARCIPLDPLLAQILAPYRSIDGFVVRPLIREWAGKYRYDLRKTFARVLKEAGITKHITNHSLRHTFASNCVTQGVDWWRVRDWLGHADVATFRLYAHLAPADRAIERVYPEVKLPFGAA